MLRNNKLDEWFISERQYYKKWYEDSHKQADAILLTVSSAALGWFFVKWKDIGTIKNFITYLCTLVVFVGFLVSILSNIWALLASAEIAKRHINKLDCEYQWCTIKNKEEQDVSKYEKLTKMLDKITLISFCIALISAVVFAISNVEVKLKEDTSKMIRVYVCEEEKHVPPPTRPKPKAEKGSIKLEQKNEGEGIGKTGHIPIPPSKPPTPNIQK